MDGYDRRVLDAYRQRISSEIGKLQETLWLHPAVEVGDYRQRVGVIRGLHDSLRILGEIEKEPNSPKKIDRSPLNAANAYET